MKNKSSPCGPRNLQDNVLHKFLKAQIYLCMYIATTTQNSHYDSTSKIQNIFCAIHSFLKKLRKSSERSAWQ